MTPTKPTTAATTAAKELYGVGNIHQVPRVTAVMVNVGVGSVLEKDARQLIATTIGDIIGQKMIATKAHTSIAAFKVREGNIVGYKATLRGNTMHNFLTKLIDIALPRTRDFHGIKKSGVTETGNLNIGLRDLGIFPEVKPEQNHRGMQITLLTTANTKSAAEILFTSMGIPFEK